MGVWFGCALPNHFGDWLAEYRAARDSVALIDKNYRAYLRFTGPDRVRYLNAILTNNIQDLAPGAGAISLLLNPQGHILAEIETYALPAHLLYRSLHAAPRPAPPLVRLRLRRAAYPPRSGSPGLAHQLHERMLHGARDRRARALPGPREPPPRLVEVSGQRAACSWHAIICGCPRSRLRHAHSLLPCTRLPPGHGLSAPRVLHSRYPLDLRCRHR